MRTLRLTGLLVAGGLLIGTAPARAQVLDFEFPADPLATDPITNGYGGFNWGGNTGFGAFGFPCPSAGFTGTGFCNGIVSGTDIAYNRFATSPVEITRGSQFIFNSVWLTSGYSNGLTLTVQGFLGITPITALFSTVLNVTSPTQFTFNWAGIDRLVFTASGGTDVSATDNNNGPYFVMDDFTYNQALEVVGVVPEPYTLGLLATGLVGLAGVGFIRRRRQS